MGNWASNPIVQNPEAGFVAVQDGCTDNGKVSGLLLERSHAG